MRKIKTSTRLLSKRALKFALFLTMLSILKVSVGQQTNDEDDDLIDYMPSIIRPMMDGDEGGSMEDTGTDADSSGIENVLLIVADDMGVDNVTAYDEHSRSAFTPTIDQLTEAGVLFRNAWANPSCAPTRGSLMTGRYAFRNGATHPNAGQNVLDTDEITIAEVLSGVGYQTALFGKWHLGNGRGANVGTLPTDQGFDHFSGHVNGNIIDYFAWPKATLTAPGQTQAANEITETDCATEVNTQEAVNWINATTKPMARYCVLCSST